MKTDSLSAIRGKSVGSYKGRATMMSEESAEQNSRMCTVRDVARLAEVSTATVSRVMNYPGIVSVEAQKSVRDAMSQLRYRPNAHAAELGRANRGVSKRNRN
jgi:hypothetical protein